MLLYFNDFITTPRPALKFLRVSFAHCHFSFKIFDINVESKVRSIFAEHKHPKIYVGTYKSTPLARHMIDDDDDERKDHFLQSSSIWGLIYKHPY